MQQLEVIVVMAAKGGDWQWQQWEVIVAMVCDSGNGSNGR